MRDFNAQVHFGLKEVAKTFPASVSLFLFGSCSRHEALPQSDLDVLLVLADSASSAEATARLRQLAQRHNFDRLDCWCADSRTPLDAITDGYSPDAGFIDVIPMSADPPLSETAAAVLRCAHRFNHPARLALKLIWEFHFSRRANDRSAADGINLKYTPGGSRDFLLFDLYARMRTGHRVTTEPELDTALRIAAADLGLTAEGVAGLRAAASCVALVKTGLLDLFKRSPIRGRVALTAASAAALLRSSYGDWFPQCSNPEDLITLHREARRALSASLEPLCHFENTHVRAALEGTTLEQVAADVDQVWRGSPSTIATLRGDLHAVRAFPILSALICTGSLDHRDLDHVARDHAHVDGHYYLNRLLLKSPHTSRSTIEWILVHNRIALDPHVATRYQQLGLTRLRGERHG